jgi:hypothetical protein
MLPLSFMLVLLTCSSTTKALYKQRPEDYLTHTGEQKARQAESKPAIYMCMNMCKTLICDRK